MNRIKELRKANGITVAELAKQLGISQSMLTSYENNHGTPRDESIWEKLADIFGVTRGHVMGVTTDLEKPDNDGFFLSHLVVDISKPISMKVESKTELEILMKLEFLEAEDLETVLQCINQIYEKDKYRGYKETMPEIDVSGKPE